MPHSRDPDVKRLIQNSRDAISTSRDLIAQSARERKHLRGTIQETRRLIEAARTKLAEGGR